MNYSEIRKIDTANGPGVRVSLFVSGCRRHCPGCFNEVTWDFNHGKEYTIDTQNQIKKYLGKDFINGLTILGGEPLEVENIPQVLSLIKEINSELPQKNIWLYSGFTIDELQKRRSEEPQLDDTLKRINYLVEGPFIGSLKDITLKFRGSSNQHIYKRTDKELILDEKYNI